MNKQEANQLTKQSIEDNESIRKKTMWEKEKKYQEIAKDLSTVINQYIKGAIDLGNFSTQVNLTQLTQDYAYDKMFLVNSVIKLYKSLGYDADWCRILGRDDILLTLSWL